MSVDDVVALSFFNPTLFVCDVTILCWRFLTNVDGESVDVDAEKFPFAYGSRIMLREVHLETEL